MQQQSMQSAIGSFFLCNIKCCFGKMTISKKKVLKVISAIIEVT